VFRGIRAARDTGRLCFGLGVPVFSVSNTVTDTQFEAFAQLHGSHLDPSRTHWQTRFVCVRACVCVSERASERERERKRERGRERKREREREIERDTERETKTDRQTDRQTDRATLTCACHASLPSTASHPGGWSQECVRCTGPSHSVDLATDSQSGSVAHGTHRPWPSHCVSGAAPSARAAAPP
jgi:hypothetical protein